MTTINNISFWPIINFNAAPYLYGSYILQTQANTFAIVSELVEAPLFEALIEVFDNPDKEHIGFYANCFLYKRLSPEWNYFHLNFIVGYDRRNSPIIKEFSRFYINNPKAIGFYTDTFKKLVMLQ
jgi:hypothetical protein